MSRSVQERIGDILQAIDNCEEYLAVITNETHLLRMGEDAIERKLQIIGDAVKVLPIELTQQYPDVPWPQIRGFRNILVHEYFGIDIELVRDVIENHLPQLREALSHFLER